MTYTLYVASLTDIPYTTYISYFSNTANHIQAGPNSCHGARTTLAWHTTFALLDLPPRICLESPPASDVPLPLHKHSETIRPTASYTTHAN